MIKASLAKFWNWGVPPTKERAYYEALLPEVPFDEALPLPKAIYQTYYRKDVPDRLAQNIELIKRLNPTYDYRLFDDTDIINFIKQHYGDAVLNIYNKIKPCYGAARADLFRYLLIYKVGGIYLDIKSSLKYPLDEVIKPADSAILSHWDNLPGQEHEGWTTVHPGLEASPRGEYVQWYLIYKAGHPLLRQIVIDTLRSIESYNPFINSVGRGGVLSTTGPITYTKTIINYMPLYERFTRVEELPNLGLIYSIYDTNSSLYGHKQVMPSNYWFLRTPVVPSPSMPIQFLSSLFIKVWYWILDVKWRLSGHSGRRA